MFTGTKHIQPPVSTVMRCNCKSNATSGGDCKETSLMGVCAACSAHTITSITATLVTLVTYATFTHRMVGKISNPASVHQKRRLNTKPKNVLAIHIQSLKKV